MNRSLIIRAGAIFIAFVIIIVIAVSCDSAAANTNEAMVSNPDDVYASVDGIDITYGELWSVMKNVDGLDYLFDYIDEVLLSEYLDTDYVDAVTQEEIDAEIRYLTYLTEDEEVIAQIVADEEIHQIT